MAKFGITGDDFGFDLPVSQPPQNELDIERKMARYSKTAEYKRLENYVQERIAFYQRGLPNFETDIKMPMAELGMQWMVASKVIAEFESLLSSYQLAAEVVAEADKDA